MSQPASRMPATTFGLRASGLETPNTGAGPRVRADDFREERLRCLIAVQDTVFRAFFKVHHELDGDTRLAGPMRIGRVAPVTRKVSRILREGRRRHRKIPFAS